MNNSGNRQSDFHYKIVLLGDSGVGKSNIISKFTKNQFNLQSKTTIGVEFAAKTLEIKDKTVRVQIWDTAGQQRYRSMASAYYRGASGALLVYDITRANSFQNLEKWIKQLKNFAEQDICCLLIGNKCDLRQYRSLKKQHGEQFAKQNNMGFLQTSALDGTCIDEAFQMMMEEIMQRKKNTINTPNRTNVKKQTLQIQRKPVTQKKKCCK